MGIKKQVRDIEWNCGCGLNFQVKPKWSLTLTKL